MSLFLRFFHPGFDARFLNSRYPSVLKYSRIISALFFSSVMIYYFVKNGIECLKYFTFEVFLLTALYFDFSVLSYCFKSFKPLAYVFFEMISPFNCIVTLVYWGYLSPYSYTGSQVIGSIVPHVIPILMNLVDFVLNEVQFYRKHYLIPFVYLVIYTFGILVPVTLADGIVYSGITFKNWFSAVFVIVIFILLFVFLEILRIIKVKCKCFNERTENYNHVGEV